MRYDVAVVGCLVVLVSGGCGALFEPQRVAVSGKVTYDGRPVEKGIISFIPDELIEGPVAGGTIENGEYRIAAEVGPVNGPHKVEIKGFRPKAGAQRAQAIGGAEGGPSGGTAAPPVEMYIPEKYNASTTLTVNLESDENTHDFELLP